MQQSNNRLRTANELADKCIMTLTELEQKALESAKHHYRRLSEASIAAIDANLSATGYRVWIYLCCLFPFPKASVEMPTQEELAARLDVSARSIRRAFNEIEAAGLWSFKKKSGVDGVNLSILRDKGVES